MGEKFDLIVIGAGPGGYVGAIKAAHLGLSVAVIEEREAGGTCLNRGCIPTKTLMHTSHLYREMQRSSELGINCNDITIDIETMYNRKTQVVNKLVIGIEQLLKANHIEVFYGKGTIQDSNHVLVKAEDKELLLEGDRILIAAGSIPAVPPIVGIHLPGVITSDELLAESDYLNQDLIIIGGGVIGVEFATIFSSLGCKVTIIEAMERILPLMDREISQNLNMIMKKRGVTVYAASSVTKIDQGAAGLICNFTQKGKEQQIEAKSILVAIGRKPNLNGLFSSNIQPDCDKGLLVNERFETSIPGIYGIGDVIHGGIQLAHVASAQACNAVLYMLSKEPEYDLNAVPSCIYTDPEISSVGLTESQAKEQGISIKVGKYSMTGNGKSIIEEQDRGFIKLVFEESSQVILGAQLMCARATDLISELSTAIVNRLTAVQLGSVIRPHPTFTEGVTEAVENAFGKAIHIIQK